MERQNTNSIDNPSETDPEKDLSSYASIEELVEEVLHDCKKSKRFSWLLRLPPSEVLWETAAAVGCTLAGVVTMGHPHVTLVVAGAVPIVIQALKLLAAACLSHRLRDLFYRLFH